MSKKMHVSAKHELDMMLAITHQTIMEIGRAEDRATIDALIGEYNGYMKIETRFLDSLGFKTRDMQEKVAELLRAVLKQYSNGNIKYAAALKFSLEKLTYAEVQDIM